MSRIIVVRHGETPWNSNGRIQGSSDIDLNEKGYQQAADAAPGLAAYAPDFIVSSPLRRAYDTATPVAELVGVSVSTDDRLRERDYGPWEGLTHPEIREQFPDDHVKWTKGEPLTNPAIETWEALARRTSEAMQEISEKADGGTALVVCHGGSARQAVGSVIGWDIEITASLSGLDNCHWAEVRKTKRGNWRLVSYNVGPQGPHQIGNAPLAKTWQA